MPQSDREKLLDPLGWKLLVELQTDARISFAELGRRVGLSTPAVAERVRRMEDEGIIRAYRAEIDPSSVGLPITAFIRMSIVGNVLAKLTERGVRLSIGSHGLLRAVTHLDVSLAECEQAARTVVEIFG